MKPSQEIRKMADSLKGYEFTSNPALDRTQKLVSSIMTYLDEQYEAEESAREQLKKDLKPM